MHISFMYLCVTSLATASFEKEESNKKISSFIFFYFICYDVYSKLVPVCPIDTIRYEFICIRPSTQFELSRTNYKEIIFFQPTKVNKLIFYKRTNFNRGKWCCHLIKTVLV